MGDLKDPRWMYLKAIFFLLIIIMCAGTLWMQNPQWQTALLIVLTIWAAARLYYFMFYVIEQYIDADYRFSGVFDFLKYLVTRRRPPTN